MVVGGAIDMEEGGFVEEVREAVGWLEKALECEGVAGAALGVSCGRGLSGGVWVVVFAWCAWL